MDTLHTVMRAIQPERKSTPDHLTVFREFLAHLDRIQHKAPLKSASAKLPRKSARRKSAKRGK